MLWIVYACVCVCVCMRDRALNKTAKAYIFKHRLFFFSFECYISNFFFIIITIVEIFLHVERKISFHVFCNRKIFDIVSVSRYFVNTRLKRKTSSGIFDYVCPKQKFREQRMRTRNQMFKIAKPPAAHVPPDLAMIECRLFWIKPAAYKNLYLIVFAAVSAGQFVCKQTLAPHSCIAGVYIYIHTLRVIVIGFPISKHTGARCLRAVDFCRRSKVK